MARIAQPVFECAFRDVRSASQNEVCEDSRGRMRKTVRNAFPLWKRVL